MGPCGYIDWPAEITLKVAGNRPGKLLRRFSKNVQVKATFFQSVHGQEPMWLIPDGKEQRHQMRFGYH